MVDIFDEISEDLRAERAQNLLRRYGLLLVLAAVLAIAGVGGWQALRWRRAQQADAVAGAFLAAMRDEGRQASGALPPVATPGREKAAADYSSIAQTSPEGYRTLARLRAAALRADADLPAALLLWDQVSADTQADPLLRDLANLLWVQHSVDAGDPAAIEGRLAPLVATGNVWRPLALEQQALLAVRTGRDARAREILKPLQADAQAPDGVRARAGGLLSRLGQPEAPAAGAGG